ncbi:MAG TPA: hypothetical protein VE988_11865 [Gemmataceae bacterium]|nr:hypothetical protein [Gemmataceae bacterium]
MIKIGEYLCGFLVACLMAPVLLLGLLATLPDIGHYYRIRRM